MAEDPCLETVDEMVEVFLVVKVVVGVLFTVSYAELTAIMHPAVLNWLLFNNKLRIIVMLTLLKPFNQPIASLISHLWGYDSYGPFNVSSRSSTTLYGS